MRIEQLYCCSSISGASGQTSFGAIAVPANGVLRLESGRKYLQEGTLDKTRLTTVPKAFEALHPDAPPSLQCTITKEEWENAVRKTDISLYVKTTLF
jgi:hypothetical protein